MIHSFVSTPKRRSKRESKLRDGKVKAINTSGGLFTSSSNILLDGKRSVGLFDVAICSSGSHLCSIIRPIE